MQDTNEVGASGIAFTVQAIAAETVLYLHHRTLPGGQDLRCFGQGKVDGVAVLLVIVAEPALRGLIHAQLGSLERQAIGDVFGARGRIARHRLQTKIQCLAVGRRGKMAHHQAAGGLHQ